MKILQVIDILNIGGAERVFVDMCNILKENNEDISALILLENSGELSKGIHGGIPIITLNRKNKWNILTMYKCSKTLRKYDIIHCHFRHVYRYIILVKKLFFVDSKIVLHDHFGSIDIDKKIPFLFDSFIKPNYYIGVSNTLSKWAEKSLKTAPENIFLLENIIVRNNSKQLFSNTFDLILVSNIKKVKNNIFAVKIAQENNNSLLLVGKNQDNTYFSELKSEIRNTDIVINSDVAEVQPILHNAKLGLHTSISETGPLVLIEYLAQGIPFLAYETGETARILKPYFPEYFIDNFEEQQWIERINKLLKIQPETKKMQEVFDKYFGAEQYYKKIMKIYQCIND